VDYETAVNTILMHSCGRDDVPLEEALFENGFLGCLRPFSGLREENFLQVMKALIALKIYLSRRTEWEVRLINGLWDLVVNARNWGLDPDGMLQRNRLLTTSDTEQLRLWVRCIESAILRLLRGGNPEEMMLYYRENRNTHCENDLE
jgi:hypothetical protein